MRKPQNQNSIETYKPKTKFSTFKFQVYKNQGFRKPQTENSKEIYKPETKFSTFKFQVSKNQGSVNRNIPKNPINPKRNQMSRNQGSVSCFYIWCAVLCARCCWDLFVELCCRSRIKISDKDKQPIKQTMDWQIYLNSSNPYCKYPPNVAKDGKAQVPLNAYEPMPRHQYHKRFGK